MNQGSGTGFAGGSANPYGDAPSYGPGGPGGPADPGGPGGFGGPDGSQPKGSGSKAVLFGVLGAVVVVAIVAVVLLFGLGGTERAEKKEVAAGANRASEVIIGSSSLVEWNQLMCSKYRGSDDGVRAAEKLLGGVGAEAFDFSDESASSFTADDVTFTNDERTAASLDNGDDSIPMVKEGDEWKICDPEIDFTQFNDIGDMADIFGSGGW